MLKRLTKLLLWSRPLHSLVHASSTWVAREAVNESRWNEFFKFRTMGEQSIYPQTPVPVSAEALRSLPRAVDWTYTFGPIRDQGKCGSCWAFAGVGLLESTLYRNTRQTWDLSEQQLVDCSGSFGNFGCRGGTTWGTFAYLRSTRVCRESIYPYVARPLSFTNCARLRCTAPMILQTQNIFGEQQLQLALTRGPVFAVMHVNAFFYVYAYGVFNGPCNGLPNHAVIIVGYNTTSDGVPYWIIRNSWGTRWGEQGYVRVIRNRRKCSIGDYASLQISTTR